MRSGRGADAARLRLAGDIDGLCHLLRAGDDQVAGQAAELLGDVGGPDAVDALLRRVEPFVGVRFVDAYDGQHWPFLAAVRALGRLRVRDAVPLLRRILDVEQPYPIEMAVLEALVAIGAAEATEPLLARLAKDPDGHVLQLLGELGDPNAVVPLLALLWHVLPEYGEQAVNALRAFRDPRIAPAMLFLVDLTNLPPRLRKAALEALTELPTTPWDTPRRSMQASMTFWRTVHHPDLEIARLAATLMTRTSDGRRALDGILSFTRGPHSERGPESYSYEVACVAACTGLAKNPAAFQDPHFVGKLIALLTKTFPRPLRLAAAEALGVLGSEPAVDALLDALGDERLTESVAMVVARLAEPPTRRLLELLAGADRPAQRSGAATALGILGCQDAVPHLLASLDPECPLAVRAAAVDSLGTLGHLPAARPLATLAEDESEPRSLRARAARALGRIGSPDSSPTLSRLARSPAEGVRLRAAQALGSFPEPEAVASLAGLADDESAAVAQAAVRSLGQLGTPAVATLSSLAMSGERRSRPMLRTLVDAIAECPGSQAVTALGLLTTSAVPDEIKEIAAEALSHRGEPECVPFLIRFLDHPPRRYQYGFALLGLARIATDEAVDYVVRRFARQDWITHHGYRDETRAALAVIANGSSTRPR